MPRTYTPAFTLLVAAAVALASGCGRDGGSQPAAESLSAADAPAETGTPPSDQPDELSAAHILVMHEGSARAPEDITRTKEEALARAQEIAEKARAEGADFAALAKEYSDGPSAPRGGNLGNFPPADMVGPFSDAVMKLAIGEVSDPVETEFGYHVIRRQKLQEIRTASAKHILVQYQGSMMAEPSITRTKDEALTRIQECLKRAREGEAFEELAREYSDGPTGPAGGDLGEFPEGVMHPAFEEAVFACDVGEITDVVETPFGYHIIYRYE